MTMNRNDAAPTLQETPPDEGKALNRKLGVGSIVMMVLAGAAPLAVVAANVPLIISLSGNVAVAALFVIGAVVLTIFAVGFTRMSRFVKNAGAFYTYVTTGLGKRFGGGAALLALMAYTMLVIGEFGYIGVSSSSLIRRFSGWDSPWWIWAVVAALVIAYLGYRDISLSSKVLGLLLIAECVTVAVFDIVILSDGGPEGPAWESLDPSNLLTGTPAIGLLFTILCFLGFEATAVFRSEAKDPERTIPRATYISVIGVGVFYAVSGFAVVTGVGASKALGLAQSDPEGLALNLASKYLGVIGHDLMLVLLVTSLFACALSFHNVSTRYLFSLGRSRLVPAALGVVHQKHGAPSRASLTISIASFGVFLLVALVGLNPVTEIYAWFSGAQVYGVLALMALTSLAVLVFFRRLRKETGKKTNWWTTTLAPAIAFVALTAILVIAVINISVLIAAPVAATIIGLTLVVAFGVGAYLAGRPGIDLNALSRKD
jgi:amino acid transporter